MPTVSVYIRAFRHVLDQMNVPRAVVTRHPLGRPLGAPGDWERQELVIATALDLLENAVRGHTVVELEAPYRVSGPG
jgi:hypothetical protein